MLGLNVMYDFLMKEMHFSQQINHIGTSHFASNYGQRVCYRMVDSIYRSDAQGAGATPPWNTRSHFFFLHAILISRKP
jgi:hypothetical protein